MNTPAKVMWGEGLFLRPQHFQQQDRYHEARLHDTATALHPHCWGVRALAIDSDALKADTLRITALTVIFPDGEIVRAPDHDPLPLQARLAELPPAVQTITFHIALPALKLHGDNCTARGTGGYMPAADTRYAQREHETLDLFSEAAPAPVSYLTRSVRLVSDLDALDACDSFPLVRLRRVATGGFEIDATFTPRACRSTARPACMRCWCA